MKIVYKELKDFPGYRVGSDGSFWSRWVKRAAGYKKGSVRILTDTWKQVPMQLGSQKYLRAWIYGVGNRKIQHLVLEVFVGKCPKGLIACHNDGDPTNNDVSNLRWDTSKSNTADRIKHGTDCRGSKHWKAKLTEDQIRSIKEEYFNPNVLKKDLAKKYGVNSNYPRRLAMNQAWKHLT